VSSPSKKTISAEDGAKKKAEEEYEELGKQAGDAFRAGNYDLSAELFTKAMELGKTLDKVFKQQQVLLANR